MTYTVPDNVVNKQLYLKIKNKIDRDLKKKGKRWSAYASGRLVKEYLNSGGKYKGKRNNSKGINRWFEEEWIDTCELPKKVACGREDIPKKYSEMKKTFPYCRPTKRITSGTPKTWKEMSKKEIQTNCKRKKSLKKYSKNSKKRNSKKTKKRKSKKRKKY